MKRLFLTLAAALLPFPALAQMPAMEDAKPECPAVIHAPAPFAAIAEPHPANAAHPGDAVAVSLSGQPGAFLGEVHLIIAKAGTYRVALDAPAWIDMIEDGKPIDSSAHTRGPDCSGIRKIVDFSLKPGDHVLRLSKGALPTIAVLVVPAS